MIDTRSNHLISNGTPQRLGLQVALSFQFLGRIDGQHPPILQHHDPDNTANAVTRDQNRREPTRDPTGRDLWGVFSCPWDHAISTFEPVVVHDGGDTVCDSDDGAVSELGTDCLLFWTKKWFSWSHDRQRNFCLNCAKTDVMRFACDVVDKTQISDHITAMPDLDELVGHQINRGCRLV